MTHRTGSTLACTLEDVLLVVIPPALYVVFAAQRGSLPLPSAQALRGEADGRALVLLDEVGTGTEPVEGAALGIALLKALAGSGPGSAALTVGTTHHRWGWVLRCRVALESEWQLMRGLCQGRTLAGW